MIFGTHINGYVLKDRIKCAIYFVLLKIIFASVGAYASSDPGNIPVPNHNITAESMEYPGEESWVQDPMGLMDIETIDGLLSTKTVNGEGVAFQTEAEALASAKLRLGLHQIIALDALRKNPKVRFWDGRLAQGYETQQQCSYIIVGGPCQDVVVNTQSGERLKLMGPNAKYKNTGVGKEIVRIR